MKTVKNIFLPSIILSFLTACGPSGAEKAKLVAVLEESIQTAQSQIEGLKNRLTYVHGELEAAQDKLLVIKQPQFLRTPDERERQIRDQIIRIERLENGVQDIKNKIGEKERKIWEWRVIREA